MNILEEAKKQGFDVEDDSGVITLRVPFDDFRDGRKFGKIEKGFRTFLKSQHYNGSYGIKAIHNNNSN